jgi:hypothetical protein
LNNIPLPKLTENGLPPQAETLVKRCMSPLKPHENYISDIRLFLFTRVSICPSVFFRKSFITFMGTEPKMAIDTRSAGQVASMEDDNRQVLPRQGNNFG